MNVDPIARWYRWIEYAAFGRKLERTRNESLSHLKNARYVLLVGDGDGRFLQALLRTNPTCIVDSIDLSPKMLALASHRINPVCPAPCERVQFLRADVRAHELPSAHYDAIATHFFLDCFDSDECSRVIAHLALSAAEGAKWVVSEFRIPESGAVRYWAAFCVRASYLFFRWTTGLKTATLPRYEAAMQANGFRRTSSRFFRGGLLTAELWEQTPGL